MLQILSRANAMRGFHGLCEQIYFPAKLIQSFEQIFKQRFIRQRAGFKQNFKMINRLVTRSLRIGQKMNELLFVTATAIAFHDI